jgi:hypothetical protein
MLHALRGEAALNVAAFSGPPGSSPARTEIKRLFAVASADNTAEKQRGDAHSSLGKRQSDRPPSEQLIPISIEFDSLMEGMAWGLGL